MFNWLRYYFGLLSIIFISLILATLIIVLGLYQVGGLGILQWIALVMGVTFVLVFGFGGIFTSIRVLKKRRD